MTHEPLALLFAAGGTGGHLFPALAVAEHIRRIRPDARIAFIGTRGKIEERIVPQHGFPLHLLWIAGIDRRKPLRMLMLPFQIGSSIVRVIRVMRRMRPGAAVCAGSYVSYPVGVAARMLQVPLVLMESNSRPGLVIRKLAPRATAVHLAFEGSKRFFPRQDNLHVSGNPVREELTAPMPRAEAAKVFGLDPAKHTLLVFGGSLGAKTINGAIAGALQSLRDAGMQVIWQTGRGSEFMLATPAPDVWQGVFIDDMRAAYAAADLAVCRAGGTTLAELTAVGVPSVLIPYPHHADQHQVHNAQALCDAGAAVMVRENMIGLLAGTVRELIRDPARLAGMRSAAQSLGVRNATERIANNIVALAERHG